MSPPLLQLQEVAKTYLTIDKQSISALVATSLDIQPGEFISIVGPSGCGKTTLLNMIAGLLQPTTGKLVFNDKPLTASSTEIGIVFQRPVLLAWRTILDNVLLPVEVLGLKPRKEYEQRARELLKTVGLAGFENRYPRELSGGMQQRASIARALIYETRLLLMDEPFAALDAMTRDELNIELLKIWKMSGRAVVFVTHNIPEAVLLSDKVVVMTPRPGKVQEVIQVDLPRPRTLEMMGTSEFGHIANYIRGLLHPSKPAIREVKSVN